jgi:hypothetical protein
MAGQMGARCWWHSWLRHCVTNRMFAGSIPDGVIEIIRSHDSSGRTVVLGSTQSLTEMSTRNISWGKIGRLRVNNYSFFVVHSCSRKEDVARMLVSLSCPHLVWQTATGFP